MRKFKRPQPHSLPFGLFLAVRPAGILPAEDKLNQAGRPVAPQARCLCSDKPAARQPDARGGDEARLSIPLFSVQVISRDVSTLLDMTIERRRAFLCQRTVSL